MEVSIPQKIVEFMLGEKGKLIGFSFSNNTNILAIEFNKELHWNSNESETQFK